MEEGNERSYTIALLGGNHELTDRVGKAFGSPGTRSDLQIYNRLDTKLGCVFTAVAPIGYPDKIKSLIQTCAISQIHIMIIDAETGITPEVGEVLLAMDLFARHYQTHYLCVIAGITGSNEWQLPEINKQLALFKQSTSLKDMEILNLGDNREDYDTLLQKISDLDEKKAKPILDSDGEPIAKVLIDHVFPVKGVGTVALGLVTHGTIHASEMYDMIPINITKKKIILRSIQKHDRDFKISFTNDRVGLALKGIKAEEITRNTIFCTRESHMIDMKMKIQLDVSSFYKPIGHGKKISSTENKTYHLIADLGISNFKILEGDEISAGKSGVLNIELENPLAHDKDGLRGIVCDFGPFEKKLRIVGFAKQNL